jgi:hypothetical protein
LSPQTTPPFSTKTRKPGLATGKPGFNPVRVHTMDPFAGSMARTDPVESAANTSVPSVARADESAASRGFSHRDLGGKGEFGGRIGSLAQAVARNTAARTAPRTCFDVVFGSPINACEV